MNIHNKNVILLKRHNIKTELLTGDHNFFSDVRMIIHRILMTRYFPLPHPHYLHLLLLLPHLLRPIHFLFHFLHRIERPHHLNHLNLKKIYTNVLKILMKF